MQKKIKERERLLKSIGLCFRCEHRALFHEEKIQPRCECSMTNCAVHSCYMFKPVRPIVLKQLDKKDKRPMSLNYFSCRVCGKKTEDLKAQMIKVKEGFLVWWEPKNNV